MAEALLDGACRDIPVMRGFRVSGARSRPWLLSLLSSVIGPLLSPWWNARIRGAPIAEFRVWDFVTSPCPPPKSVSPGLSSRQGGAPRLQPAGAKGSNPDSLAISADQRIVRRPWMSAACMAFSAPKAKLNSALLKPPQSFGAGFCRMAAFKMRLRPSSAPSDASISHAALFAVTVTRTFSKPSTMPPSRLASPSRSRQRRRRRA